MRKILAICQILLLQKCQGIIPSEEAGVQILSAQEAGCQPLHEDLEKYVCSGLYGEVDLSSSIWQLPGDLQSLTITDSEKVIMNLATLTSFTKLTNLIIQDSQVTELKINGSVPEQVKVLKFVRSWSHCPEPVNFQTINCETQILDLNSKVIYSLRGLEELHVTNCTLSSLTQPELPIKLNITGGSINCLSTEYQMLPQEKKLVDFLWMGDWIKYKNAILTDDVMCFLNIMHFTPLFSLNDLSIKNKIEIDQETLEQCPSDCKCILIALTIREETGKLTPMLELSCNNVSLKKIPTRIPKYTTSFQASNNNITDLNEIFENDLYLNIHKFVLHHNNIRSINGEKFYKYLIKRKLDFALDLSDNEIEELPAHEILMAYKFKKELPHMKIINNPFNCRKCDFLVNFQDLLSQHSNKFEQKEEIRCGISSEYWHLRQVLSLDVKSTCAPDEPYLDKIDFINITLASVLLLLLVNFAYNLYQYKTHSKLPWIVTKGPLGLSQGY